MDQLQPNEALSLEQLIIAHRHILRYYDEKIAKGLIPPTPTAFAVNGSLGVRSCLSGWSRG